ncbi:hypothetical protein [Nonomuraea insulae]|uniref:Uncharacterized protein n=1 Tax=Nonomuraea insulae TaxID=1616787 RepID=A0ABW1D9D8_9ACTN
MRRRFTDEADTVTGPGDETGTRNEVSGQVTAGQGHRALRARLA